VTDDSSQNQLFVAYEKQMYISTLADKEALKNSAKRKRVHCGLQHVFDDKITSKLVIILIMDLTIVNTKHSV
jgi:CRISPR/Cas system CMR-associated protein Cmr3 (group 5 of RAMP superfamily)